MLNQEGGLIRLPEGLDPRWVRIVIWPGWQEPWNPARHTHKDLGVCNPCTSHLLCLPSLMTNAFCLPASALQLLHIFSPHSTCNTFFPFSFLLLTPDNPLLCHLPPCHSYPVLSSTHCPLTTYLMIIYRDAPLACHDFSSKTLLSFSCQPHPMGFFTLPLHLFFYRATTSGSAEVNLILTSFASKII